jgi:hypothetical protein
MSYPDKRPLGLTLQEAFDWFVPIQAGDCRLWPASITKAGYGQFKHNGRHHYAHVVAYERHHGPVPAGMEVDHIDCVAPCCIEPTHLRAATRKQNMENRRGARCDSHTQVRGVWWHQGMQRYMACVINGYEKYAKTFDDLDEAAAWVISKRLELFTHNAVDRREAS